MRWLLLFADRAGALAGPSTSIFLTPVASTSQTHRLTSLVHPLPSNPTSSRGILTSLAEKQISSTRGLTASQTKLLGDQCRRTSHPAIWPYFSSVPSASFASRERSLLTRTTPVRETPSGPRLRDTRSCDRFSRDSG
ncbi:hypothetical protein BJ546DRAFT_285479 [Cryomyces antarcticus]